VSELPRGLRQRRRWPLPLTAFLGLLAVSGWWWAPAAVGVAARFLDADLQTKDSLSSVISMLVGVVSLLISVLLGVLQLRKSRQQPATRLVPWERRERQTADRLRAFLGRQDRLPRLGDRRSSALALRVHPAIDAPLATPAPVPWWRRLTGRRAGVGGLHPDLPTFVERDKSDQVRGWMRQARTDGGFLILVGDSCVGKTRLLYETARTELYEFAVLAPDLGDGGLVNTIAQATFPLPKMIVWLDELQRFLPGPYLTDGSTPITAAAVRQLLDAPTPVVILATLWPAYATTLRAGTPASDGTDGTRPHYPKAVDILTDRRIHETRLDTFSGVERISAAGLAAHDPRLAAAVADRDYNVTEALAGVRELVDRYHRATATQRAVIHAAVDARRVGIQPPLTEQLLCAAARSYLTTVQPDDAWFVTALQELTSRNRPQDKATAPLIPIASPDRRTRLGYDVAEYLLQHLVQRRRTIPVPRLTWNALATHTDNHNDLDRLADEAIGRLVYTQAIHIYQRLADAGYPRAASSLADLLASQGRVDDLRVLADSGNWEAASLLARLLAKQGRVDEAIGVLQARAESGDGQASAQLADLLASQGRVDDLRALADSGSRDVASQIARLLAKQGRVDEAIGVLQARAEAGDSFAASHLVTLLVRQGRVDEAIAILRAQVETGYPRAASSLVNVLASQGRVDDLRALAESGNREAASWLARLLAKQGRVDEAIRDLRARAEAGDRLAASHLVTLLAQQGRVDEAITVLQAQADAGDHDAPMRLAVLLADHGRVDDLRARAETGDRQAVSWLAELLAERGRVDEAIAIWRAQAETGDKHAALRLVDLLAEQGRIDELRVLAETGDRDAVSGLVDLLAEQGRVDELRARAEAGDWRATSRLVRLLAQQGRVDEAIAVLRVRADTGDLIAGSALVDLLADHERVDDLRAEVHAGTRGAGERLLKLLVDQGNGDLAEQIRQGGLDPDNAPAPTSQ
jgi:tetratricopeptide (TPR) repeat protein